MVNKVTLIGRLGKDPEVRTLDSGTNIAKFSIATDESYKDKNGEWQTQTEWHTVILWRGLAERAEQGLRKGYLVYVEGKLTSRSWQDDQGNTNYITEIRGNYFRVLQKETNGNKAQAAPPSNKTAPAAADTGGDDLPF